MTLPANIPPAFRTAACAFAYELRANFASRIPAQPEDQLKLPIQALLRAAATDVFTRTEAQVVDLGGRPDIGVTVRQVLCGYVELKAPGHGARVNRFTGRDKEQWEKFKALPNILYTDACEWALYRSGRAQPEDEPLVVRLEGLIERGAAALNDEILAQLHTVIIDFLSWGPIVPSTPSALAELLAPLCRLLRSDVRVAVAREGSALRRLSAEMRDYLFPHTDDDQFADIYAQTLTYALLLARLSGETNLTAAGAADRLDTGHGLLADTLRVLTQPRARQEIEMPVGILERVIGAVDPARLSRRGDPWLYFYEHFLAAYDPKLRKNYGVYYTPQQVIHCQIALVSELLTAPTRFNKPLAFADEGVVFLDSSAGTAAYPLAAIESALALVESRFGIGMVPAMATRCAQNIYGFEVLVGPYAVAHLRLTNVLAAAGATLPPEGIHMLLTDTLESPYTDPPQPPLMAERLTTEQRRARGVKSRTPVFVCMGNPPYFREEGDGGMHTRGKWVRFGDENTPGEAPILEDFLKPARDAGMGIHLKNLYNLYVYFWRWTLWKMFENANAAGPGIVSFITAASYLRGPGFGGMRQLMREKFDEIWIIDLEGDNLGTRKTENVFAIQTPVCIATGVRHNRAKRRPLAHVRYTRVTGTREGKLSTLAAVHGFNDLQWRDCFSGGQDLFWPLPPENYSRSPLLTDLWPWQHSGVQWKRSWPIGETQLILAERWRSLLAVPPDERGELMRETTARTVYATPETIVAGNERLPSIASLAADSPSLPLRRYAHRSFDRRWVLPDNRLCDRPRPPLWRSYGESQVFITSLLTTELGHGPSATACSSIPDLHHFRGSFGGKDVIPLWRDSEATIPNLPAELLNTLSPQLGRITPADFFAYTYAILSAPSYVETFWEELTARGPRIPVTRDRTLFNRAVEIGSRLLWHHTYGDRYVPTGNARGNVQQGLARCLVGIPDTAGHYPESIEWNATTQVLSVGTGEFGPVPRQVWEYSVSGFSVVEGWAKSRLRDRTGKRSSPLDEIRPASWSAEMTQELQELLWLIEATIAMQPDLDDVLANILAGQLFRGEELPAPTAAERSAPGENTDDDQTELGIE